MLDMEAYVLIALCLVGVGQGLPVNENETTALEKEQDASGFFIPMDTWQSFQNQLQLKTNSPPQTTTEANIIKLPSQPNTINPTGPDNGQINLDQIQPKTNNPIKINPQPGPVNQPIVLQPGQFVNQAANGQTVTIPSGTVQGNQPIILVQQPLQNKPVVQPQQLNQPLYIQPGQTYVLQNGQDGKPTQVLVAMPSNNQGGFTNTQPSQYQDPVYTLVLNQNSNANPNGNLYLVPVQSGSSNPIIVRTSK